MKKTISAAIGGRNFILDEDAYQATRTYLDDFRYSLDNSGNSTSGQTAEVMDELEMRISDLFKEKLKGREVVDLGIVRSVTEQLGMPDSREPGAGESAGTRGQEPVKPVRRFYRDMDGKALGGVCSGLALYLNIDVVLIRILFVVALLLGSAGFWIYLIFCIIAPAARTATEKCELRGIPATAENIRRFSNNKN